MCGMRVQGLMDRTRWTSVLFIPPAAAAAAVDANGPINTAQFYSLWLLFSTQ